MATKITVKSNGSTRIEGDIELYDGEGNKYDLAGRTKISLCRCGLSKDMPFCDSSHKQINYFNEVKARTLEPPKQA